MVRRHKHRISYGVLEFLIAWSYCTVRKHIVTLGVIKKDIFRHIAHESRHSSLYQKEKRLYLVYNIFRWVRVGLQGDLSNCIVQEIVLQYPCLRFGPSTSCRTVPRCCKERPTHNLHSLLVPPTLRSTLLEGPSCHPCWSFPRDFLYLVQWPTSIPRWGLDAWSEIHSQCCTQLRHGIVSEISRNRIASKNFVYDTSVSAFRLAEHKYYFPKFYKASGRF
jgi:hypothetical protein